MFETYIATQLAPACSGRTEAARGGERQFREALPLIKDVLDLLCRQNCLPGVDEAEFRSLAFGKLIENDYDVLRRFSGKSTLRTFLLVVLQRALLDHRARQWGTWRPSIEAKRLGPVAVRLEQLISCEGMTAEQAIDVLRSRDRVDESAEKLRALASELPPRPHVHADVRATVSGLFAEERLILKLRYVDGLTISQIARLLRTDAGRLYRRVERILAQVREQLRERGIDREFARLLPEALRPV
jgi:RNA polymerase sigma factor (sigma-70 family)